MGWAGDGRELELSNRTPVAGPPVTRIRRCRTKGGLDGGERRSRPDVEDVQRPADQSHRDRNHNGNDESSPDSDHRATGASRSNTTARALTVSGRLLAAGSTRADRPTRADGLGRVSPMRREATRRPWLRLPAGDRSSAAAHRYPSSSLEALPASLTCQARSDNGECLHTPSRLGGWVRGRLRAAPFHFPIG